MLIGILADTHDEFRRTEQAVDVLRRAGAELLVHCGDLIGPEILHICSVLPLWFTFGNHDGDVAHDLEIAASASGATCLGWGGEFVAGEKRIAVVHGHLTMDLRPLLEKQPDYLLSGHSHTRHDFHVGRTRRINPGALHRTETCTVATLDTESDALTFHEVDD